MDRDVAVAASGHLGTTIISTELCWSSRFLYFIFHSLQSQCFLQTGGGCLLYLVASSARLWLGFVFTPFILFPFQSRTILPWFCSLGILKHI